MTILELKKLIENVPDDFIFEIDVEKKVSDEELSKMSYKYPFDNEICQIHEGDYDIGWLEKKMRLSIQILEL